MSWMLPAEMLPGFCQDYLTHPTNLVLLLPTLMTLSLTALEEHR